MTKQSLKTLVIAATFLLLLSLTAEAKQAINTIATQKNWVALTFDDGPTGGNNKILEILKKENIKATFFLVGSKVKAWPDQAKKILEAGHELGNHSYNHPKLNGLSDADVEKEILSTQDVIEQATGYRPKVFRAPNLIYTDVVWKVVEAEGMQGINANLSAKDWDKKSTVEQIIARTTEKAEKGSIMLMHDWPKNTAEALPKIIAILKEKGFGFGTVSELLADRIP